MLQIDQAYAKIQSINGQQYFIRKLPLLITSKSRRHSLNEKYQIQCLGLTNSSTQDINGVLYFDYELSKYRFLAFGQVFVNGAKIQKNQKSILNTKIYNKNSFQKFNDKSVIVDDLTNFYFHSEYKYPQIFYFTLPQKNIQIFEVKMPIQQQLPPSKNNNKLQIDKSLYTRWTTDDREQLKKLILQYGYGRWKQLQRSSTMIGGKLETKSIVELKAFANSFIRSLGLSLPEQQTQLKSFLQNLIQQQPEDLYLQPNLKDWDQQILLSQRSVQYTKRLQLLHRIKTLVRKYKQECLKNMTQKDKTKVNWDGLLNFIPLTLLFGQRPSVWWAKKHDIDLILGVYKYGYANYSAIKSAKEYCFAQLQKAHTYQDFPTADNLTRRLKKLMQTIVKIEMSEGKIDFQDEGQSQEDDKNWTESQKKTLFKLLTQYGVPLTLDGRSNWVEIRQRMKNLHKQFDKNISQIQKMVSKIRWSCQQLISQPQIKSKEQTIDKFVITIEGAAKFSKNMNMLGFIRKSILANQHEMFQCFQQELKSKNQQLKPTDPAYIQNYDCLTSDLVLLSWVSKNGLVSCSNLRLNEAKVNTRIQWLCQLFKQLKDKNNDKKKKYKQWESQPKKRTKFQLNRDKSGNILFPIIINPSLKLVAIGRICPSINYHSEHNLFPIGYISIRTHASMFTKGARCNYTCQILEGQGKPIYKVTSEQEPNRPIIRDSSTGCWVYICQKVNQLQQVKKQKVTISGTERFGLLEPNVVRLLEDLPQSQKCLKYKFKYKQINQDGNIDLQ